MERHPNPPEPTAKETGHRQIVHRQNCAESNPRILLTNTRPNQRRLGHEALAAITLISIVTLLLPKRHVQIDFLIRFDMKTNKVWCMINQSELRWHSQYQGINFSKAQFLFASVCPQTHKHRDLSLNEPFREHPAVDAKYESEFQWRKSNRPSESSHPAAWIQA